MQLVPNTPVSESQKKKWKVPKLAEPKLIYVTVDRTGFGFVFLSRFEISDVE